MPTLTELKETELFGFFAIEEIGRSDDGGLTKVDLKTGSYREFIDITLWVDAEDSVRRASLFLDRSWIGNEENVSTFGTDVAKSFLATFVTFSDCPYIPGIIQGLWELKGTGDKVFYFDPEDEPKPQTDPVILSALDVYLNKSDDFELGSPAVDILFKNLEHGGRERLLIDITYK